MTQLQVIHHMSGITNTNVHFRTIYTEQMTSAFDYRTVANGTAKASNFQNYILKLGSNKLCKTKYSPG